MPKVVITNTKGLVQEAGTGVDVQSTVKFRKAVTIVSASLSGQANSVKTVNSATQLKHEDSGKVILIGDNSSTYDITLPDAVQTGWHARFILTGALSSAVVVTGSGGLGTTVVTGSIITGNNIAARGGDVSSDGTAATFVAGGGGAGTEVELEVLSSTFYLFRAVSTGS